MLRDFVQHGSKTDADGRIVWKRDPAIQNGFVPTELWATVAQDQGADHLHSRRREHDRSAGNAGAAAGSALPQVEIVTMPGLGHYPSDEKPGEFLAIVDRFLAATKTGK